MLKAKEQTKSLKHESPKQNKPISTIKVKSKMYLTLKKM